MTFEERARQAARSVRELAADTDTVAGYGRVTGHRSRTVGVALAGTAAVVALIAAVAVGGGLLGPRIEVLEPVTDPTPSPEPTPGEGSPSPTTSPTPSPSPSPSPTASPTDLPPAAAAPSWTWRRIDDPDLDGAESVSMRAVAQGPAGLVGVGDAGMRPAIWSSSDGEDWERVPTDPLFGEASGVLNDVLGTDGGYVAVGELDGLATAWSSRDGETWTRQERPAWDETRAPRMLLTVVTTPQGVLAMGVGDSLDDAGNPTDAYPVVWRSPDGAGDWTEVQTDWQGPVHFHLVDTVVSGGTIVAAIHDEVLDRPAVMVSADGARWEAAGPADVFPERSRASAATGWEHGFVVVGEHFPGTGQDQDGIVWTSVDGRTWTRVDAPALRAQPLTWLRAATTWNGGLVTLGQVGTAAAPTAWWWRTHEGAWETTEVETLPGAGSVAAATVDAAGRLVAVGQLESARDGLAAGVWIAEAAHTPAAP